MLSHPATLGTCPRVPYGPGYRVKSSKKVDMNNSGYLIITVYARV